MTSWSHWRGQLYWGTAPVSRAVALNVRELLADDLLTIPAHTARPGSVGALKSRLQLNRALRAQQAYLENVREDRL